MGKAAQATTGTAVHTGYMLLLPWPSVKGLSKLISAFLETLTYHQDIPGDKGGN